MYENLPTAATVKVPAEIIEPGDRLREKVYVPEAKASVFMAVEVVSVDRASTSSYITLRHPISGGTYRIRPRNTKIVRKVR
jgi:hypothetical protein